MHGIVDQQQIKRIAERIAAAVRPERIMVFGSYARGEPHEESDLNLCVIVPEAGDWLYRPHEMRRLVPVTEVALELLVVTPSELEHLRSVENPLVEAVVREGKVLYERE